MVPSKVPCPDEEFFSQSVGPEECCSLCFLSGPFSTSSNGLCELCARPVEAVLTPRPKFTCAQVNDDRSEQPVSNFCEEKGVKACHPDPPSVFEHPSTVSHVQSEGSDKASCQFEVLGEAHLGATISFDGGEDEPCPTPNDDRVISPVILVPSDPLSDRCHSDSPSGSEDPRTLFEVQFGFRKVANSAEIENLEKSRSSSEFVCLPSVADTHDRTAPHSSENLKRFKSNGESPPKKFNNGDGQIQTFDFLVTTHLEQNDAGLGAIPPSENFPRHVPRRAGPAGSQVSRKTDSPPHFRHVMPKFQQILTFQTHFSHQN